MLLRKVGGTTFELAPHLYCRVLLTTTFSGYAREASLNSTSKNFFGGLKNFCPARARIHFSLAAAARAPMPSPKPRKRSVVLEEVEPVEEESEPPALQPEAKPQQPASPDHCKVLGLEQECTLFKHQS